METIFRTFVKSITFRILATITTFAVVLYFTGSFGIAGTIGGIDAVSKLGLYYFHERAWDKCHWGIQKQVH